MLISVRTVPLASRVMPFVFESYGDAVARKAPELLHQTVVEFFLPLPFQKGLYGLVACEEFRAIARNPRYGCATISGSRLFQSFSPALTLARAVSREKGGAIHTPAVVGSCLLPLASQELVSRKLYHPESFLCSPRVYLASSPPQLPPWSLPRAPGMHS